jgi:hypothetical protein
LYARREFELLSTSLQDGERKDEQHQRSEQTKHSRHPAASSASAIPKKAGSIITQKMNQITLKTTPFFLVKILEKAELLLL